MQGLLPNNPPQTVDQVFGDYRGRRAGLINALTTDKERFQQECDPEKENLCLFGHPNETWEVNLPVEEVPPEIPEPALGINFARDEMGDEDWFTLVAVHSDSWLIAVAFFFGAHIGFERNDRQRLFRLMNDLPTIYEVLTGKVAHSGYPSSGRRRNKSRSKIIQSHHQRQLRNKGLYIEPIKEEVSGEEREEDDEEDEAFCGACGIKYGPDEFWICCDVCEKWYHGNCVQITPAMAEHIDQYHCPGCSRNKRPRV